jgi:sulfur carrier protein
MTVTLTLRKKEYQIKGNVTLKQALQKLNLTSETHLVIRNGELLTKKELLEDGDVVNLVAVISGGWE